MAVVIICGSHADLFRVLGGAHTLLVVAGLSAATFGLSAPGVGARWRGTARLLVGIAVPTMAVALLGFSWHQSQRTLGATLEETSAQLVDTLEARTQALVRPARVAIDMLANGAPGEADDWDGRLAALPLMRAALEAHRLVDAVYIGYGSGDFLMFRAVDWN